MKSFNITLGYKVGDEFEAPLYVNYFMRDNFDRKFKHRIKFIEITINKDGKPDILYTVEFWDDRLSFHQWRQCQLKYTESQYYLKKFLEPDYYDISVDFKYDIGDIIAYGVNSIVPSDPKTFKDCGQFSGSIVKIGKLQLTIHQNSKTAENIYSKHYIEDCVLCDRGKIYNEHEYNRSWIHLEKYVCLVSELNTDKIIEYVCKTLSKKVWREDAYHCLYNQDGSDNMDNYDPNRHKNDFAAYFKYLGVEEKAKNTYIKFIEDREEGRKPGSNTSKKKQKSKNDKLDDLLSSLSEKDKEKLLKKLMKNKI